MIVIPPDTPAVAVRIIRRAQQDIPIVENPPSSNRSPEIDAMCRRFGVPLGSFWCALWAADVWKDAGAEIPPINNKRGWHPARCETWREWALETHRLSPRPALGAAPLYGVGGKVPSNHMGACIVSLSPVVLSLEGNTALTGYTRNGELTALKAVDPARVIGYVHPEPIKRGVA
jgi:hypothetical protein